MELAGTAINAAVVAAVGLILGWLGRGQFGAIARQFGAIARQLEAVDRRFEAQDQRFDRLEERLDRRFDALQASLDATRSDLTQVALAVGVRPRATNA